VVYKRFEEKKVYLSSVSTIIAITKTNAGMTANRTILKIIEVKFITKYKE
jgi:hypothetical protein|tara:strand:+ start:472 stop:621 length:150 start_codon:yes stop_codon:yes gene_type:complete